MTDFIGVYDLEQDNNFCSRVMEYVNKIKMLSRIDNQETSTLNISGDEYFFITEDDKHEFTEYLFRKINMSYFGSDHPPTLH